MDLGIRGRKAIVCASSRGLGKACALSLAKEGVDIILNGLDAGRLEAAARDIRAATGVTVTPIQADITTQEGRDRLIAACPDADILINNNAGPPPGKFVDWGPKEWEGALNANMLPAVFLMRALIPGMRQRRFGRIVNILSAMVKSPRFADMGLSTAARTALMGISKSVAREVIIDNVTINNMMPERIDTDRQKFMAERMMKAQNIDMTEARRQIADSLPAKRFGTTEEFGDTCAFLCSAQSGFMTGQNLQLDGGSYEGLV
ncbi:MAG: SDR family oxidoreductase [Alphaproteobacteria bacterium]|nr:SDR family oxidoreductase [Alphaproteobacteria bacterium]